MNKIKETRELFKIMVLSQKISLEQNISIEEAKEIAKEIVKKDKLF